MTTVMENLIQTYSGVGRLIFANDQIAAVNYSIDEFQTFVPDGTGGELPSTLGRRGRVYHAEGHPNWHPVTSLNPGPFTLVMEDGRKLKVILENLKGSVQGTGDFF
jgi:hypothetical protein